MSSNICQKITAQLQCLFVLKKEYDQGLEKHQVDALFELQNQIIDTQNLVIEKYQEFLWPAEKYPRITLMVGGKSEEEIIRGLRPKYQITTGVYGIFHNPDFQTLEKPISVTLICLNFNDLKVSKWSGITEIIQHAKKFGLEPCPVETAPYLRPFFNQESNTWYLVVSRKITNQFHELCMLQLSSIVGSLGVDCESIIEDSHKNNGLFFCVKNLVKKK